MTLTNPLPPFTDSGLSVFMYLVAAYIFVSLFTVMLFRVRSRPAPAWSVRPIVWLGAANASLGLLGFFVKYTQAMEAVHAAGDISPSLVAGAHALAGSYPVLGFLSLAAAFLFQFINTRVKD